MRIAGKRQVLLAGLTLSLAGLNGCAVLSVKAPVATTADHERTLMIADTYASQGLYDRAESLYSDVLRTRPHSRKAAEGLARIAEAVSGKPGTLVAEHSGPLTSSAQAPAPRDTERRARQQSMARLTGRDVPAARRSQAVAGIRETPSKSAIRTASYETAGGTSKTVKSATETVTASTSAAQSPASTLPPPAPETPYGKRTSTAYGEVVDRTGWANDYFPAVAAAEGPLDYDLHESVLGDGPTLAGTPTFYIGGKPIGGIALAKSPEVTSEPASKSPVADTPVTGAPAADAPVAITLASLTPADADILPPGVDDLLEDLNNDADNEFVPFPAAEDGWIAAADRSTATPLPTVTPRLNGAETADEWTDLAALPEVDDSWEAAPPTKRQAVAIATAAQPTGVPGSVSRDLQDATTKLTVDAGDDSAWATFDRLLRSDDAPAQTLAVLTLGELPASCHKAAARRLQHTLAIDPDDEVRSSAALALGGLGDAAEPAVPMLREIVQTAAYRPAEAARVSLMCLGYEE